ncbi:MAG: hypothetical protein GQ531_09235 [Sulfurovum sp.]|nr:hypothetical protein [Sulfurovum sp.]
MLGLIIVLLIISMVVVLLIVAFVSDDTKLMIRIFLGFIVLIGLMVVIGNYSCGPNSHDVKVMKPQAKAIADYIVKKGIPKSLKDIPDLPYVLVECEREENYMAKRLNVIVESKKNAGGINIAETCVFKKLNSTYQVKLRFYDSYILPSNSGGEVRLYRTISKTGVSYGFKENEKNNFEIDTYSPNIYSIKSSSICKSFGRQ